MELMQVFASQSIGLRVTLRPVASYSGKSITVDVLQDDGTVLVNDGACTEVGATAVFFYDYTTPSTAQNLTAIFYDGSTAVGETINIIVSNTIASAGGGSTDLFTTVDAMVTRLNQAFVNYKLPNPMSAGLAAQYINEGVSYLQRRFDLLRDDFVYNVTLNGDAYQVDSVTPYPYRIDEAWYNTGASEVPLTHRDRVVTRANVAASVTTITGYTDYKDTYKTYVQLDGKPAAAITSGLRLNGPYFPLYVSSGQTMPIEKKYDLAVERAAVYMATAEYHAGDVNRVEAIAKELERELRRVGLVDEDKAGDAQTG